MSEENKEIIGINKDTKYHMEWVLADLELEKLVKKLIKFHKKYYKFMSDLTCDIEHCYNYGRDENGNMKKDEVWHWIGLNFTVNSHFEICEGVYKFCDHFCYDMNDLNSINNFISTMRSKDVFSMLVNDMLWASMSFARKQGELQSKK